MARTIPDLPRLGQPASLPTEKSSDSFWHTEPSPLLLGHRSTRSLPATADVVIIGSGITGTSIARHLLKGKSGNADGSPSKSHDVVMLEAREACWGATGRVRLAVIHTREVALTRSSERRTLPTHLLRIPPRPRDWPLRARQLERPQARNRNQQHRLRVGRPTRRPRRLQRHQIQASQRERPNRQEDDARARRPNGVRHRQRRAGQVPPSESPRRRRD